MKKVQSGKKESVLKVVILVIIIAVFSILMLQPEQFNYPYSVKDIQNKKELFENLNTQILQEQQMLKEKQKQHDSVISEYNLKQQNTDEVSINLNMQNLDLHIPSLLLVLEDQAVENELSIHIRYDKKSIVSNEYPPIIDTSEVVSSEVVSSEPITIEPDNTNAVLENNTDTPMIQPIDGLNILVLPIEVEGGYEGLREFIKFLDTMDFIIPYSINVEAQGDYVIGEIIVQIFYEGEM